MLSGPLIQLLILFDVVCSWFDARVGDFYYFTVVPCLCVGVVHVTQVRWIAEVASQFDLLFCCSTQLVSAGIIGSCLSGRGCPHELTVERGCYLVSVFQACVHTLAHTVMAYCVLGVWFCTSTPLNKGSSSHPVPSSTWT